ncbi:uncharacterized protein LOC129600950 [Paramacrobiotus metropolitanus]|uniref:uncharacterized protein LOC129600950 n=1 Tax=Paramacrobiotus metropolitanus TaxID=2943436 RepID=UPI002445819D|nr:uncharacterized protein LOC129600950 [Paramacrobiotus metropolitanus]
MAARAWNQIFPHGSFSVPSPQLLSPTDQPRRGTGFYLACYEEKHFLLKELELDPKEAEFNVTLIDKVGSLLQLNHENTTKYFGLSLGQFTFDDKGYCRISSQYYSGGDLNRWVRQLSHNAHQPIEQLVPHTTIRQLLRDLLEGLHHIYTVFGIIHCDIKPENLVLRFTDQPHLAIIDFEDSVFSDHLHGKVENTVFTKRYAAPELLLCSFTLDIDLISHKTDIWSVGCVALQMYTGQKPIIQQWIPSQERMGIWDGQYGELSFNETYQITFQVSKCQARPKVSPGMDTLLFAFIQSCLQFNMDSRSTAMGLLEDPNGYLAAS